MAVKNFRPAHGVWYWTTCLGATVVIGCGSSTPPPPPAQAPAATTTAAPAMPPSGPATPPGHSGPADPAAAMAAAHASAPAATPADPMTTTNPPGTVPASGHSSTGPTATPASGPTDPMAVAHNQASNTANPPGSVPGSGPVDPNAQMKAHAQAATTTNPTAQPASPPGHAQMPPGTPGAVPMATAENPGAPMPAVAGGNPGTGGQQQQFPPGSAEDSLAKFCMAMADSNLTEAAQFISPKAKGVLQQIREGTISDDKLDGMKDSFSLQGMQLRPSRPIGSGRTINLANAKSELLSFTLMKEDETYLLREFTIKKAPR